MTLEERVELSWDDAAAAWRIAANRSGAAGSSEFELGTVSWRFDRADPSLLVEAVVVPSGDAPDAPVAQEAIDAVALLCGDRVARALERAVEAASADAAGHVALAPESAALRRLAGRRGLALEVVDSSPSPTWWTVEAVWTAARLGAGSDALEHAAEAFDLLDSLPAEFLGALAEEGLHTPVRDVLLLVGLAEHELPEPLRLAGPEVDSRFESLVAAAGPSASSAPLLGAPTFRRRAPFAARAAEEHSVDWIDVPVDSVRRAVWTRAGDGHVSVQVTAAGRPPSSTRVRLLDVAPMAPVVLAERRLEATGTRSGVTTLVATFQPPSTVTELAVELVDADDDILLPRPYRVPRHATNLARAAASLERSADAEARMASDRAAGATRLASRAWAQARQAWASAGDVERARACGVNAARLDQLLDPSHAGAVRSDTASVAGWAEMATALARALLADLSAVGVAPELSARDAGSLAGLAESVEDLELAARFRADQARSLRGAGGRAIARLAVEHFEALGVRPPADLVGEGRPK